MTIGPAPATTRASIVLSAFVAISSCVIIAQAWWSIEQDRQQSLDSERENGTVAVRLLDEHAAAQLEAAAQRLVVVAEACANIDLQGPARPLRVRAIIEDVLRNSRSAAAYQYVTPEGARWASLTDFPAFVFNAEERPFIKALLARPDEHATLIAAPFMRFIDSEPVLPMVRNLFDRKGRHLGLISTEIDIRQFRSVYERVAKSSGAVVQLFHRDGFMILRAPLAAGGLNLNISGSALMQQVRRAPEGFYATPDFSGDAKPRWVSFRQLSGFPVAVALARTDQAVLAGWRARTRDKIGMTAIFVGLQLLLTYYLLLHMRRLHRSDLALRASEARFVDLFERAPIPLALIRLDNDELVEANDAILQQFGYRRGEFIGQTPLSLGMWVDASARAGYIEVLRSAGAVDRYEAQLCASDGQSSICLLSSRLIESGGRTLAIFSPIDISRQRQVEGEIRELNTALEQRVLQRTEKLEAALATVHAMQAELVRSEKLAALGSLVAGIAHELNTPIGNSVTVGSTVHEHLTDLRLELDSERPRRQTLDKLLAACQQGSNILMRNLQRAVGLVASFKQVAVDQSSDQRRRFELGAVVQELADTLAPMYKGRHQLILDLAPGLQMDSYPGAIGQILTNFVSNAVNHGFESVSGGTMRLQVAALDEGHHQLVFSDDGGGVAPEHLGKIFDPFFTTKLGQGGSGLGMHIVYNLSTSILGGNIALDSPPGQGLLIRLVLPCVAPQRKE